MWIKNVLRAILTYYRKLKNIRQIKKNIGPSIGDSNLFNNEIEKCFQSRILKPNDDLIYDRIIQSYIKSKEIQKNLSNAYQVGNEWLPIYNHYMGQTMTALKTKNKECLKKIYENFMREDCSVGLHGLSFDMKNAYFKNNISNIDKELFFYDTIYRYNHWRSLTDNKFTSKDLKMSDYGNPYGIYDGEDFIRIGSEYLHYYSYIIDLLLNKKSGRKYIVELGGGYGGLGYFLNKNICNLSYIDFDLPENMALTAFYLLSSFPEKKVLLFGEGDLNEKTINDYDIILMPNFELSKLPDNYIDLIFNSYSLAEMSSETINEYIPHLMRSSNGYILHINHAQKSYSLKADEFGITADKFDLVYKKPALWNMGRNINMDEFEYLYKKK
jgi:putative sugar O-methyltransferase